MRQRRWNRTNSDLGLLTDRLTTTLQRALREDLDPDFNDIGPRHRALLARLEPGGSRAIDLARDCGQHKQVIGTLVDDLERLGYVRREPDPGDRRVKRIIATDLGLRQRSRIADAMANIERKLASALGEQQYGEFKDSFEQVTDLLSGP